MTPSEKIEALEALRASDGWRILEQTMGAEIEQLTTAMIEGPGMSNEQREFTRGALFSARRMLKLPDTLIRSASATASRTPCHGSAIRSLPVMRCRTLCWGQPLDPRRRSKALGVPHAATIPPSEITRRHRARNEIGLILSA